MPRLDVLSLEYAIEARDLTVRTCHLDPDFASLSLAAVAMEVEGCRWHEHRLTAASPEHWTVHVPLPKVGNEWILLILTPWWIALFMPGVSTWSHLTLTAIRLLLIGSPPALALSEAGHRIGLQCDMPLMDTPSGR